MNMTTMMHMKTVTSTLWISLLSLLIIILLHHSILIIQSENGWGYQIVIKQKVLIYQPTIPAIDTVAPFPDETSTRKVGILVLKRFNAHSDFSVSKEEVLQRLPANFYFAREQIPQ